MCFDACRLRTSSICSLFLIYVCLVYGHEAPASSPNTAGTKRVAVIGAGIGGAAFSFYYANMTGTTASINVFDAHDYIGGRLKHTILGGQVLRTRTTRRKKNINTMALFICRLSVPLILWRWQSSYVNAYI